MVAHIRAFVGRWSTILKSLSPTCSGDGCRLSEKIMLWHFDLSDQFQPLEARVSLSADDDVIVHGDAE